MNKTPTTIQTPPTRILLLYAVGQMGWSLAAFAPSSLLNYFYLPPEDGKILFPLLITLPLLIGLINGVTRGLDAFIDPYIANLSDRSTAKIGKRKAFMLVAFLPFAALSFLIFTPPIAHPSTINTVWIGVMLFGFHLFLSMYTTPYTALISELGHTKTARLNISAYVSLAFALGAAIGNQAYSLQSYFEQSMPPMQAFQAAVGIFALLSAVFMLVPILFVDEKRYSLSHPSEQLPLEAIKSVWANKNFRAFALSDCIYWVALTFIQSGIVYYITVLLRLDKNLISSFTPVVLILLLALYYPVMRLAVRYGKKQLLQISFLLFAFAYGFVALLGKLPLSTNTQALLLLAIILFPMGVFSILPNAVVADIADKDAQKTGDHKAGMFFGIRILIMKLGVAVANMSFSWLLLLGKSTDNDLGIRLTAALAMLGCLAGFAIFRNYKEE